MNAALSCIEDTIRLLMDEAREAKRAAVEKRGTPEEAFEVGRASALTETLHTWSNQLQTFEVERDLGEISEDLRAFLVSQGY